MSWRVRRAAAKVLVAIITAYPDRLKAMYMDVLPMAVRQFREREEKVKFEIMRIFTTLLRQTRVVAAPTAGASAMDIEEGPMTLLRAALPAIYGALRLQISAKSSSTRLTSLQLLKELMKTAPVCGPVYVWAARTTMAGALSAGSRTRLRRSRTP